jgi:hypothetical protein
VQATTDNDCTPWQLKILNDKQLVLDALTLRKSDDLWGFFANVTQHAGFSPPSLLSFI